MSLRHRSKALLAALKKRRAMSMEMLATVISIAGMPVAAVALT
ncbi:hypothetical protein [Zymomonas mobilis]